MWKTLNVAALLAGTAFGMDYTPEALAAQVTNLPGTEKLDIPFNQFSGYVKVNGTKNLHYWMVESQRDPSTDPIAFWTNGGPGCSGLVLECFILVITRIYVLLLLLVWILN
jgi:hypothetical protein